MPPLFCVVDGQTYEAPLPVESLPLAGRVGRTEDDAIASFVVEAGVGVPGATAFVANPTRPGSLRFAGPPMADQSVRQTPQGGGKEAGACGDCSS
jgi:hypothetical protein